jgi:hypothetical protein
VISFEVLVLRNPGLGVPTPRPPVEEQDAKRPGAAPQTPLSCRTQTGGNLPFDAPLHKGWIVWIGARFALASLGNRSVGGVGWLVEGI